MPLIGQIFGTLVRTRQWDDSSQSVCTPAHLVRQVFIGADVFIPHLRLSRMQALSALMLLLISWLMGVFRCEGLRVPKTELGILRRGTMSPVDGLFLGDVCGLRCHFVCHDDVDWV